MKQFIKYTLATVVGLLIFSFVAVFMFMSVVAGAMAVMGEASPVSLKPNSVYVLELDGVLEERSQDNQIPMAFTRAMGQSAVNTIGLDDILKNIEKAKNEPAVKGIYLKGGMLSASYASIEEIRQALLDFKTTGKFIIAYADHYTQSNYYLATVADRIYLNEQGMLAWQGLHSEHTFYTNLLDKLGVEMQVVKVGTFKSAVEPYINTKMSEPNRLQVTEMLRGLWGHIVANVAEARQIPAVDLQRYADNMMMLRPSNEYLEARLVDSLVYETEMEKLLNDLVEAKADYVNHTSMCAVPVIPDAKADKVAVIYAVGGITDNEGDGIVGKELVETVQDVARDKSVKGVVLRVNSPGGSAFASEQIWHALSELKKDKPLVVSMGDYAASGGYYIACMADAIVAQPTTLTGSIGIFGLIPNVSGLTKKIGLDFDGVGTNCMVMETDMVLKGMDAEERALMQGHVNRGYELFVKRCADGRDMTVEQIKAIGEGRVWLGTAALANGLVDTLGGLDDAIRMAADRAGLNKYRTVEYPAKKDFMTRFVENMSVSVWADRFMQAQVGEEYRLMKQLKEITGQPSLQAVMPDYFIIK